MVADISDISEIDMVGLFRAFEDMKSSVTIVYRDVTTVKRLMDDGKQLQTQTLSRP